MSLWMGCRKLLDGTIQDGAEADGRKDADWVDWGLDQIVMCWVGPVSSIGEEEGTEWMNSPCKEVATLGRLSVDGTVLDGVWMGQPLMECGPQKVQVQGSMAGFKCAVPGQAEGDSP